MLHKKVLKHTTKLQCFYWNTTRLMPQLISENRIVKIKVKAYKWDSIWSVSDDLSSILTPAFHNDTNSQIRSWDFYQFTWFYLQ